MAWNDSDSDYNIVDHIENKRINSLWNVRGKMAEQPEPASGNILDEGEFCVER
jgi:hypothetical protein